MDKYIGTAKAAETLGRNRDTVAKMCRNGTIKSAEQDGEGKPWRMLESEIIALAEKRAGKK